MSKLQNSLIVSKGVRHSKMTELNHLGLNLMVKPTELEGHITKMFSATQYYSNNALASKMYGSEEFIDSVEWTWKLENADSRPAVCMGNVEPSAVILLGEHNQPFFIFLDEDWYGPGDNLTPGTSHVKYQLRVEEKPVPRGKGYIYKVRLANSTKGFPASMLKMGKQFGKLFSNYEEGAIDAGTTQFGNTVSFANRMSLLRKEYKVTNWASTATLSTKIPTKAGMKNSWIAYAEAKYFQEFEMEKEKLFLYGQSSSDLVGSTGRAIVAGPGIQQMIQEDGEVYKTSQITATLVEEFMMDVMFGKKSIAKGQKVVALTGLYGMLDFHRAYDNLWEKKGARIMAGNFNPVEAATSEYHSNAYSYGYRFTKFKLFNGQELELVHCPAYDDTQIHFEKDNMGVPLESRRITFLDFGDSTTSGKNNVRIMKKKDGYAFAYVNGLYGPTGPTKGGTAAHKGSYYEMVMEDTLGVHIEDITRCGEILIGKSN